MAFLLFVLLFATILVQGFGQLSTTFYDSSCPNLQTIVRNQINEAIAAETRMGASLLRLHFHDCFVDGCDGSLLLDDTDTFTGEQTSPPNLNSVRGFEVIDDIKALVEAECPNTVSCADILTLSARDSVNELGGPSWEVPLGRRDSLTANESAPVDFLPGPDSDVATLRARFEAVGLSTDVDLVALSGGHSFGKSRCSSFTNRIGADPVSPIDPDFNATLNSICSAGGDTLVDLDQSTPTSFDNGYYTNLLDDKGLLPSDQALETEGGTTADLVGSYATTQDTFFTDFANSMINMGNIRPLTGSDGEIRVNCGAVNPTTATM